MRAKVNGPWAKVLLLLFVTSFAFGQTKQETDLAVAKKNFEQDPSEENYIWYGRRTAYTGNYPEAVDIYTQGLKKYPGSYRLLRHRGHRYISLRKFELAIVDLAQAEKLMAGKPLEVEADGIPNKINKPLSTTQFNVFYHLALAHYLKADFAKAEETWRKCLTVSENDDSRVAALDWLYMSLRRQTKKDEATKLLDQVNDHMDIVENDSYYQRLKMYKNGTPLPEPTTPLDIATLGYGLGNWYLYNEDKAKATEIFKKVVSGTESAAFGFIAAEAELSRLTAPVAAVAPKSDSLVLWNELVFSTPFERESFHSFLKKKDDDYLRMFLANDPTGDDDLIKFRNKTKQLLDEIRASSNMNKKNAKKIKYIYDLVHKKFFTQYETENRFYEIIQTGKYNCVTATALYAWFFEQLNIPYTIKEEPTHVYLVAYPNSDNIMVESTTPLMGFYSFNPEFKTTYVRNLKDQKVIGPDEATQSIDVLFNKYYFGTGNISLTQLIGIHYMNDGLFLRDQEDVAGAYEQFKKAYFYYPGTRCEFLLMSFASARIEDAKLDPLKRATLIGVASRMKKTGITSGMILGEFQKLTQEVLIRNNDRTLYKKCYQEIIRNVADPALLGELSFGFNYENGRIYYNTGNYAKAQPYLVEAFKQQPSNADLGAVVVACVTQSFRNIRDTNQILDSLQRYQQMFPLLNEDSNFNSALVLAYAVKFGDAYDAGRASEGDRYQKLFEDLYRSDKNISLMSPDVVGRAYSNACAYYFKKGQKTKALQFLEWGLAIVPNDYQLKARKQMISMN